HADGHGAGRRGNDEHQCLDRLLPEALVDDEEQPEDDADDEPPGAAQRPCERSDQDDHHDRRHPEEEIDESVEDGGQDVGQIVEEPREIGGQEVEELTTPAPDRDLPTGNELRNRVHNPLRTCVLMRRPLPAAALLKTYDYRPRPALTAARPSEPSKVVTPASHGSTTDGLAFSHSVAASLGSLPSSRIAPMISFSICSEKTSWVRNLPRFGHSVARPLRVLVRTVAPP